MIRLRPGVSLTCVFAFVCLTSRAAADPLTFSTRTAFTASVGSTLVDDYSHLGYQAGDVEHSDDLDIHTDAHMNAVLGETRYQTTGWANHNIVSPQGEEGKYCGGCNGSFLLTFNQTSIGNADGVYGVAFDFSNAVLSSLYGARVTFGDGTVRNYALPYANTGLARDSPGFWGISAPELIYSIHFGPDLGARIDTSGSFSIDNLTLGGAPPAPVPEPATMLLVGSGIAVLARLRQRHAR